MRPVSTGRDPHLVGVVKVVWENGHQLCERHGAPLMERDHLALVLALAGAMLAPAKHQNHEVVTLKLRQASGGSRVVREGEVGEHGSRGEAFAHCVLLTARSSPGHTPGIASRMR